MRSSAHIDWKVKTFPLQVRVYFGPATGDWQLWSRHREKSISIGRALAEAKNEYPQHRVVLVDARKES